MTVRKVLDNIREYLVGDDGDCCSKPVQGPEPISTAVTNAGIISEMLRGLTYSLLIIANKDSYPYLIRFSADVENIPKILSICRKTGHILTCQKECEGNRWLIIIDGI